MTTTPAMLQLTDRHTGEVLEIRREARDGGARFLLHATLPAQRPGPPLHLHHVEDEEVRIISGTLSAETDGRRLTVGAGGTVHFPRGVPHRWWNDGDEPLAFEGSASPATDLDRYLQAVFEVANAGPPHRPPLFYMAHVALRHRRTQTVLIMPPAVQAIVFPVVVAIGTLLGRYRGTDWPGCPARCTGVAESAEIRRDEAPPLD